LLWVVRHVKVPLGTFACNGIEANLGADIVAGVRAALSDFTQRLESGRVPIDLPRMPLKGVSAESATAVDLDLDERTWQLLQREARRQGTTVGKLAAHSVLVYLAELDRLTPPSSSATA
jgi:hypothetical protein